MREFNSLDVNLRSQRQIAGEICRKFARDPSKGYLKKLKALFQHCGEQVFIEYEFHCDYGSFISIGDRTYINKGCTFLDAGKIEIGNDCLFGPNVQLITVTHPSNPSHRLQKTNLCSDIQIGNNVFIGAGAIILPGVTIGDNTIIGAGSVVTKSFGENEMVAGNPATKLKK